MRTILAAGASLLLALATPAFAQTSTSASSGTGAGSQATIGSAGTATTGTNTNSGASNLDQADQHFLRQTAQGAEYELKISQLAEQKATAQDVKSYAQSIVSDHQQMNAQLHQVAEQNGLTLPTSMTQTQQKEYQHLQSLSGKSFDQAYISDMRKINQRDTSEEQKVIGATRNQQIKSFATQLQQSDRNHATIAENLKA